MGNNNFSDKIKSIRWGLVAYDFAVLVFSCSLLLLFYKGTAKLGFYGFLIHSFVLGICSFASRFSFGIYNQVWRYGGIQSYIKLLVSDGFSFLLYYFVNRITFRGNLLLSLVTCLSLASLNLLLALSIRMIYRYAYKFGNHPGFCYKVLKTLLKFTSFGTVDAISIPDNKKIKVAIVGAGNIGLTLAEDLLQNAAAAYFPVCFIDTDKEKIGREIHNLPVLSEDDSTLADLENYGIQEVIFAIPATYSETRKKLYNYYKNAGYKIKVYDFPNVENVSGQKRHLREFDPEELLFRKPLNIISQKTIDYYYNKVVLITGGGGSIGSELCRQIAKMKPKQLIIVDIYENGAYDIQQEIKIAYRNNIDIRVEIASVTNKKSLARIFDEYHPQIVLNAAAHKHVPLMEKNCIEAVENNVFGTLNTIEISEEFGVERLIMVSTDKAVNPTNVMGATKRMCEMIVQAHSAANKNTTFSITRFGNVLGSAGSVIPLFKKQIACGGPITLTDRRIIRYFMTIPEASQLVLTSGGMAKNGELFVLDMGEPVKIADLAENMIRLSGMEPGVDIEIVETGLRPGEKLYEELLVKTENLDKTDNEMIFIECDVPYTLEEIDKKINILREAIKSGSDIAVRNALMDVVPTYKSPEIVNAYAENSEEIKTAKQKSRSFA